MLALYSYISRRVGFRRRVRSNRVTSPVAFQKRRRISCGNTRWARSTCMYTYRAEAGGWAQILCISDLKWACRSEIAVCVQSKHPHAAEGWSFSEELCELKLEDENKTNPEDTKRWSLLLGQLCFSPPLLSFFFSLFPSKAFFMDHVEVISAPCLQKWVRVSSYGTNYLRVIVHMPDLFPFFF